VSSVTEGRANVPEAPGIVLVRERRIEPAELARLVLLYFEDMVKYVVDVERGVIGLGGDMHADAEQLLLEDGSHQANLWGANYYPGRGRDQQMLMISNEMSREKRGLRQDLRSCPPPPLRSRG